MRLYEITEKGESKPRGTLLLGEVDGSLKGRLLNTMRHHGHIVTPNDWSFDVEWSGQQQSGHPDVINIFRLIEQKRTTNIPLYVLRKI